MLDRESAQANVTQPALLRRKDLFLRGNFYALADRVGIIFLLARRSLVGNHPVGPVASLGLTCFISDLRPRPAVISACVCSRGDDVNSVLGNVARGTNECARTPGEPS